MDAKKTILENALPLVPFDGWSDYTLKEAAKRANLSESELKRAFPGGCRDCVAYFLAEEDKALQESFSAETIAGMKVPERIEAILLARLKRWWPNREVIKRTMSFHALPWNNLNAYTALYHTVDIIWRMAGDRSVDFNFYTKRMTLAAVYSSTLLFWLNDSSDHQQETALFLKRRLANVAEFGRFKKQVASCFN